MSLVGENVTELMFFSSERTMHFHEERTGTMEKACFDINKERAAE